MRTTTEMKLVPIDRLVPYINNARTHSPEQIKKLRASLREFGFVKKNVRHAIFFVQFRAAVILFFAGNSWYNRD